MVKVGIAVEGDVDDVFHVLRLVMGVTSSQIDVLFPEAASLEPDTRAPESPPGHWTAVLTKDFMGELDQEAREVVRLAGQWRGHLPQHIAPAYRPGPGPNTDADDTLGGNPEEVLPGADRGAAPVGGGQHPAAALLHRSELCRRRP